MPKPNRKNQKQDAAPPCPLRRARSMYTDPATIRERDIEVLKALHEN
jgi:hypothetical protein